MVLLVDTRKSERMREANIGVLRISIRLLYVPAILYWGFATGDPQYGGERVEYV